jgi:hypothetical protein
MFAKMSGAAYVRKMLDSTQPRTLIFTSNKQKPKTDDLYGYETWSLNLKE